MAGSGNIIEGKIEQLLIGGRDLIESGKLNEAMIQLTEVLLHDKKNTAALRYLDRIWASKRGEILLPQDGGPSLDGAEEPDEAPDEENAPQAEAAPATAGQTAEPAAGSGGRAAWSWPGDGVDGATEPAAQAEPARAQTLPEEAILGPAGAPEPVELGIPVDHSNLPPASDPEPAPSRFQPLEINGVLVSAVESSEIPSLGLDPIADYALRLVDGKLNVRELADQCLLDPDSALSLFQDLVFRGAVRIR